ncbi:hypothetical protein X975_25512, partial [Stegodyphus mimosarum]
MPNIFPSNEKAFIFINNPVKSAKQLKLWHTSHACNCSCLRLHCDSFSVGVHKIQ